jgi:hypothetical protein
MWVSGNGLHATYNGKPSKWDTWMLVEMGYMLVNEEASKWNQST